MRLHISQTTLLFNEYFNKYVFAYGHNVSNIIDSTHFYTLRGDFRSISWRQL